MSRSDKDPPEAIWIDRCAQELGRLVPGLPPDHVVELSWDVWRDARGVLSPEHAARLAAREINANTPPP
jgi:hypothetical protein